VRDTDSENNEAILAQKYNENVLNLEISCNDRPSYSSRSALRYFFIHSALLRRPHRISLICELTVDTCHIRQMGMSMLLGRIWPFLKRFVLDHHKKGRPMDEGTARYFAALPVSTQLRELRIQSTSATLGALWAILDTAVNLQSVELFGDINDDDSNLLPSGGSHRPRMPARSYPQLKAVYYMLHNFDLLYVVHHLANKAPCLKTLSIGAHNDMNGIDFDLRVVPASSSVTDLYFYPNGAVHITDSTLHYLSSFTLLLLTLCQIYDN
jgi:hypothetical protein